MNPVQLLIMLGVFAAILVLALVLKRYINPEEQVKPQSKEEIVEEEMRDLVKHDPKDIIANSKDDNPKNDDNK